MKKKKQYAQRVKICMQNYVENLICDSSPIVWFRNATAPIWHTIKYKFVSDYLENVDQGNA